MNLDQRRVVPGASGQDKTTALSLDDAVRLALERNLRGGGGLTLLLVGPRLRRTALVKMDRLSKSSIQRANITVVGAAS